MCKCFVSKHGRGRYVQGLLKHCTICKLHTLILTISFSKRMCCESDLTIFSERGGFQMKAYYLSIRNWLDTSHTFKEKINTRVVYHLLY